MLVQQVEQLTEFIDKEKMRRISRGRSNTPSITSPAPTPVHPHLTGKSTGTAPTNTRSSPPRGGAGHSNTMGNNAPIEARSRIFSPNTRMH